LVKTRGKKFDPIVEEAMSVYEEIPDDVWRITEKPEE
jgi:hypothetical protein